MTYLRTIQGTGRQNLALASSYGADIGTTEIEDGAVGTAQLADDAVVGGGQIVAGDVETAHFQDQTVTYAIAGVFISTEQTGTGVEQNIAHGIGPPTQVMVFPTDLAPGTDGDFTATEGTHDGTNVKVTVTSGKKFKVMAWM